MHASVPGAVGGRWQPCEHRTPLYGQKRSYLMRESTTMHAACMYADPQMPLAALQVLSK